ncbi:MAG TPA: DUF4893 domain-containing protein [Sphingomicrobium sp.]|nr:DUF4893 domain-containing protein [Sphingomicrobium sp.]
MRFLALLILTLLATGCDVIEQPAGLIPRYTTAYKDVISRNDRVRLSDWRQTFESALDAARKSGHASEIEREGRLLDPDAAVAGPSIPNGMYRCRVIKLGAKDLGNLDYVAYGPFSCRVRQERALQRLAKLSGPQRYVGLIFPGDPLRNVFLGTVVFADENRALQYGQDQLRDVAGYVERIGPNQWRVLMPRPHFESRLDVMELVPEGVTR